MVQEKDNSIKLIEQIFQIKQKILIGENEYPIDIVDTIENDNQLYYEEENGYWEQNIFNKDNEIVGHFNALGENIGEYKPFFKCDSDIKAYIVNVEKLSKSEVDKYKTKASDVEFIEMATKNGWTYTLTELQNELNNGFIIFVKDVLIRFI